MGSKAHVTCGKSAQSRDVALLERGERINVVEVLHLPLEDRVRARIERPAGWITYRNTQTGASWAGPAVDIVVKIGGSAGTHKSRFETLNKVALEAVADQLKVASDSGQRMAVIHGAGSFGHQQAKA